jgi:hypothetical protein
VLIADNLHRFPAQHPRGDLVDFLNREGRTAVPLQGTEDIGNLACGPRGLDHDSAARKLVQGDLLYGMNTQMFQKILRQGNLRFGVDGKRGHGGLVFQPYNAR